MTPEKRLLEAIKSPLVEAYEGMNDAEKGSAKARIALERIIGMFRAFDEHAMEEEPEPQPEPEPEPEPEPPEEEPEDLARETVWEARLVDANGEEHARTQQQQDSFFDIIDTEMGGKWLLESCKLGPFVLYVMTRRADEENGPRIHFVLANGLPDESVGYYEKFSFRWLGQELSPETAVPWDGGLHILPQTRAYCGRGGNYGTETHKPWLDLPVPLPRTEIDKILRRNSHVRKIGPYLDPSMRSGEEGGAAGVSRFSDWAHTDYGLHIRDLRMRAWAFRQPIWMIDPQTLKPLEYRGPYAIYRGNQVRPHGFENDWTVDPAGAVPGFALFPDGRCSHERDSLDNDPADGQHYSRCCDDAEAMRKVDPTAHIIESFVLNQLRIVNNMDDVPLPEGQSYFWNLRKMVADHATPGEPGYYMGRGRMHELYTLARRGTDEDRDMIARVIKHHSGPDGLLYWTYSEHSIPYWARQDPNYKKPAFQGREAQFALRLIDLLIRMGRTDLGREREKLARSLTAFPQKVVMVDPETYKIRGGLGDRAPIYHLEWSDDPNNIVWGPYGDINGLRERALRDGWEDNVLHSFPFQELLYESAE